MGTFPAVAILCRLQFSATLPVTTASMSSMESFGKKRKKAFLEDFVYSGWVFLHPSHCRDAFGELLKTSVFSKGDREGKRSSGVRANRVRHLLLVQWLFEAERRFVYLFIYFILHCNSHRPTPTYSCSHMVHKR